MAAWGRGLFSLYIYIENFKNLCPWKAYVVTQSLASASVDVHVGARVGERVRVSTMFKFSKVCIVF